MSDTGPVPTHRLIPKRIEYRGTPAHVDPLDLLLFEVGTVPMTPAEFVKIRFGCQWVPDEVVDNETNAIESSQQTLTEGG